MTFHAMTEHYEEITVCGKPALFTSIRIRRDTIPDGLYAYDVRHDDECRGIPCEIAPFVMVNQKRTRRTQYNRDGWFSVRLVLFPTENKKVSKKDPNLA